MLATTAATPTHSKHCHKILSQGEAEPCETATECGAGESLELEDMVLLPLCTGTSVVVVGALIGTRILCISLAAPLPAPAVTFELCKVLE